MGGLVGKREGVVGGGMRKSGEVEGEGGRVEASVLFVKMNYKLVSPCALSPLSSFVRRISRCRKGCVVHRTFFFLLGGVEGDGLKDWR